MAVTTNDDMVMHHHTQRFAGVDDRLGHLYVRTRRAGIARRMIVQHTTNFGIYLEIKTKYENFR